MRTSIDFTEKIELFFDKYNGNNFAIAGGTYGIFVFLVAGILHSLSGDIVTFSTHYVSDLGVGANGSSTVFMFGVPMIGIILFPYMVYVSKLLWMKKEEKYAKIINFLIVICFVTDIISVVGLFILSLFNMNDYSILHTIGTGIFFTCAGIFIVIYTLLFIFESKWSKIQIMGSITLAIMYIIIGIVAIPIIESGNIFESTTSINNSLFQLFEWLIVLGICTWLIVTGKFSLKTEFKNE